MKIIARHKNWVVGATICESVDDEDTTFRRFVATINGWRNFKIYEGFLFDNEKMVRAIIRRVQSIKERIEKGDDSVFKEDTRIFAIK